MINSFNTFVNEAYWSQADYKEFEKALKKNKISITEGTGEMYLFAEDPNKNETAPCLLIVLFNNGFGIYNEDIHNKTYEIDGDRTCRVYQTSELENTGETSSRDGYEIFVYSKKNADIICDHLMKAK